MSQTLQGKGKHSANMDKIEEVNPTSRVGKAAAAEAAKIEAHAEVSQASQGQENTQEKEQKKKAAEQLDEPRDLR